MEIVDDWRTDKHIIGADILLNSGKKKGKLNFVWFLTILEITP